MTRDLARMHAEDSRRRGETYKAKTRGKTSSTESVDEVLPGQSVPSSHTRLEMKVAEMANVSP